jgi:hypothetical protein
MGGISYKDCRGSGRNRDNPAQMSRNHTLYYIQHIRFDIYIYLTAVWLTPGGSSTSHIYTQTVHLHTDSMHNTICIPSNSEGSKKLPDDGRVLPKHVGASIWNKGAIQSVHILGHLYYA